MTGAISLWVFVELEGRVAAWLNGQTVLMQNGTGFLALLFVILVGALVRVWLSGIPDPAEWSSFAALARTQKFLHAGRVIVRSRMRIRAHEASGSLIGYLLFHFTALYDK